MNTLGRKLVEMGVLEAEPHWFEVFLGHFQAFVRKRGHGRVPVACRSGGYRLGSMTSRIRSGVRKLTNEQRAKLDALGFIWSASLYGLWWREFIPHLRAFVEAHGHCEVPSAHECQGGYALGAVVIRVRVGNFKLSSKQRAELDALGFVWDARNTGKWWDGFITHLRAFVEKQGSCEVPLRWECSDGYKLGMRVGKIRAGSLKITDEQRAELAALGFVWDARPLMRYYHTR